MVKTDVTSAHCLLRYWRGSPGGGIVIRNWMIGLLVAPLTVVSWPAPSSAQVSLNPEIGWNFGVHGHLESRETVIDSRVSPVLGFGLFKGSYQERQRDHRYGFDLTTQQVKTLAATARNSWNYRMTSFRGVFERLLRRGDSVDVILDLGLGLVWRTDGIAVPGADYCDAPFCSLPHFYWLFSPGAKTIIHLAGPFSFTLAVRGNAYSGDATSTYPFKSGVMILAGIEWHATPYGSHNP